MPAPPRDQTAPLMRQAAVHAPTLPAARYWQPDWHQHERDRVFRRSWQLLGPAADVDAPNTHLLADIGDVPVIVIRDGDGTLRGFHNVCRHRAGPLAFCAERGRARLRCHYHGWSYATDGRLLSATDMEPSTSFDPASVRLPDIRVETWNGLLFGCLDDSVVALHELLDGIDDRTGRNRLHGYHHRHRVDYDIACNWKTYVDNFLEGYHLPHVHPTLNQLLDYRCYRTECARWSSLQYSPVDGDAGIYADGEALYWYLWPNTMLNILPGRMQTNRVIPIDAGHCRVRFDYYYPADALADAIVGDHAFSDGVQAEDIDICEQVQRGLASGSYDTGWLNPRHESGLLHFHNLLREALHDSD